MSKQTKAKSRKDTRLAKKMKEMAAKKKAVIDDLISRDVTDPIFNTL